MSIASHARATHADDVSTAGNPFAPFTQVDGPGPAAVDPLVARGDVTPQAMASLVARHPAQASAILARLHHHVGNGFVADVVAILDQVPASRAGGDPEPAGAAAPVGEAPIAGRAPADATPDFSDADAFNRGHVANVVRFDRATHGAMARPSGQLDAAKIAAFQDARPTLAPPIKGAVDEDTVLAAEHQTQPAREPARQPDPGHRPAALPASTLPRLAVLGPATTDTFVLGSDIPIEVALEAKAHQHIQVIVDGIGVAVTATSELEARSSGTPIITASINTGAITELREAAKGAAPGTTLELDVAIHARVDNVETPVIVRALRVLVLRGSGDAPKISPVTQVDPDRSDDAPELDDAFA